jgi:hypothetical protein
MRVIEFTESEVPFFIRLFRHMCEAYGQPAEAHRNGSAVGLYINQQVPLDVD